MHGLAVHIMLFRLQSLVHHQARWLYGPLCPFKASSIPTQGLPPLCKQDAQNYEQGSFAGRRRARDAYRLNEAVSQELSL